MEKKKRDLKTQKMVAKIKHIYNSNEGYIRVTKIPQKVTIKINRK